MRSELDAYLGQYYPEWVNSKRNNAQATDIEPASPKWNTMADYYNWREAQVRIEDAQAKLAPYAKAAVLKPTQSKNRAELYLDSVLEKANS